MYAWFESRVNPYPSEDPTRPPEKLFPFIMHYSRPVLGWLVLMTVLTAAIGVGTLGLSGTAAAHDCEYGYGPTYRAAYYPAVVPYYPPPQFVYYPRGYAAYRPVIVDTHRHHHHHHSGVTLTVGF